MELDTSLYPFLRKAKSNESRYYVSHIGAIDNNIFDESFKCEMMLSNGYVLKYKLTQFPYLFINNFDLSIELPDYICHSIKKITELTHFCTKDSIRDVFENYPYTSRIIVNDASLFADMYDVTFSGVGLSKSGMFATKSLFYDGREREWVDTISEIAIGIIQEMTHLKVDFSKLRQQPKINLGTVPPWVKTALVVGGVVIIKVVAKSIIQNADFDFDFDSDNNSSPVLDVSQDDVVWDLDNNISVDNNSDSGLSSLAFRGHTPPNHSTDGFIFQGGEKYNGFQVYTKQGHTYYWDHIKDIWVKIK